MGIAYGPGSPGGGRLLRARIELGPRLHLVAGPNTCCPAKCWGVLVRVVVVAACGAAR